MTSLHNAYAWGVKAARAGLSITENPYANCRARAHWLSGYHQARNERGIAPTAGLSSAPVVGHDGPG